MNIIYYFSGTGNSLSVAKQISKQLPDCDIRPMGHIRTETVETCDSIGFVCPCYFEGLPNAVEKFITALDLSENKKSYLYAIITYGGVLVNALGQMDKLFNEKNIPLAYRSKIKMFSNYIIMYDMDIHKIQEKNDAADKNLQDIIEDILLYRVNKNKKEVPLLKNYYRAQIKKTQTMDKHYKVSKDCVSCGICEKICPVDNIQLIDGKPTFLHHCEQCMACIQYCPQKAINYKLQTQLRKRYTNPKIPYQDISRMNHKKP